MIDREEKEKLKQHKHELLLCQNMAKKFLLSILNFICSFCVII